MKRLNFKRILAIGLFAAAISAGVWLVESGSSKVLFDSLMAPNWTPAVANEPILALWCRSGGMTRDFTAPYLRFAIWEDGLTVFAADPEHWTHELLEGKLSEQQIAELKQIVAVSGVQSLSGTSHLVPCAPDYHVIAVIQGKKYMLGWDEVETPNYGIMGEHGSYANAFIKCWKKLNDVGVTTRPATSSTSEFQDAVTRSWK